MSADARPTAKRRFLISDECWLLVVAFVLFASEVLISASGELEVLAVGFLGGMVYGLTNVNDYRINRGRPAFGEGRLMDGETLLAYAGTWGAALTAAGLVPFYFLQGWLRYDYHPSPGKLLRDIEAAAHLSLTLPGGLHPPAIFVAGVFTVFWTWLLFKVVQSDTSEGGIFAIVIPVSALVVDLLVGSLWLHEPLTTTQVALIAALVLAIVAVSVPPDGAPPPVVPGVDPDPTGRVGRVVARVLSRRSGQFGFAALCVIGIAVVDFTTSRVGARYPPNGHGGEARSAMVSICFRAEYFTAFFVYAGIWFHFNREKAATQLGARGATARRTAIVTAFLFTGTFFLTIPAIASSLALGPLAITAGSVLAFAVAGAVYGSTGAASEARARLRETLLAPNGRGRLHTGGYAVLIAALVAWVVTMR